MAAPALPADIADTVRRALAEDLGDGDLTAALVPEARLPQASLDDWLGYLGLRAGARHRAVDDAFVTAELFLVLLARARAHGLGTVSMLHAACEQQARLVPGGAGGGA